MAVRHRLIRVPPRAVWDVLADGDSYVRWVVGTSDSWPLSGAWPAKGAAIGYAVPLGPFRLTNETVVRRCTEETELELEIKAGRLGTARVALELRSWGEDCLVFVNEHPLTGVGGRLHNAGLEVLLQLRNREMLGRLAAVCEDRARTGSRAAAPPDAPAGDRPGGDDA